ncbi:NAD-dependent succinate-semialdehyde dehydrogenase [Sinorhizobium medicae]|uniref:NAD-dependent succinate-semialdehyde dehydrogenase n=1 Tax=Sinorhizobium medicae TaxID=110321 RepID=UPI000C7A0CB0|nr:NAD-dependent succinate-semialdehyde dehydrogenase [Sinorhizobium medicae]MDX0424243.1 aldehyde dehydrogenase family protein [Sinorhizobium medicae]PLT96623.1 NAD-dependent succinate-semialdehyde dehydrogenase [Sinorhizobium medicae]TWA24473.1 succinate-semialdehyde dehydrogenase/glutarate-semialdehyde dehydrogenase [Sinorhizobium medicae]TWA44192.1 succinate-semialdehyde dehydrogenase/glutarate-semialdehyde dehydrogenase [Sinorhizobium medicae]
MTFQTRISGYADPALHAEGLYIGGKWQKGSGIAVTDPSTGNRLTEVADASVEDAIRAVAAAETAAAGWRDTPARQRSEILRRWFQLMTQHAEDLATLIALENGKALSDARGEVTYAAEFFRWYAEEATRIPGEYRHTPSGSHHILVDHEPIGIAVLITPWNFPAAMATRKIGPALAAGCTVILKPASETPLTAYAMARLGEEAGVPAGVVNVLTTSRPAEVTNAMLADPRVRKLSFTGSTGVGRTLLAEAAKSVVSCSMELGGNAPFVVFDDADLEAAIDGAMVAKMRNAGEACTAANRFYVQSGIHDAFVACLTARMAALKIGPGYEPSTQCGPMITQNAVRKIDRLVSDAVAGGARATTGGKPLSESGYFYPPTVLENVPVDAAIAREEIFGPVAPIYKFDSEEEVIRLANDTEYGLAAYIYSGDLKRAMKVGKRLEAGMLGINRGLMSDPAAPFGGVKQSGLGREGGVTGILEFMEAKYYAVDY